MTKQISFTKIENDLLPKFRKAIGAAESTEDVKKFFIYTIQELLNTAFAKKITFTYDDISFKPNDAPPYVLNKRLYELEDFASVWKNSDLPNVIARFIDPCINHYRHLEKNPAKTETKIRM